MKRTERHQLKENEVVLFVTRAKEALETYRREITVGLVAVAIVVAGASGYAYWRQRVDRVSRTLLADAMAVAQAPVVPPAPPAPTPAASPVPGTPDNAANPTTPSTPATPATPAPPPSGSFPTEQARLEAALTKFMAAASAYPSTPAGLAARYQAGATLAALGRLPEAMQRYQEVIDRGPSSIYAETARLGLADTEARAGKYEDAIVAYKTLAANSATRLPVDGILMQLGRAYAASGRGAEAQKTFQRIVDEFPDSSYAALARKAIDNAKLAAR